VATASQHRLSPSDSVAVELGILAGSTALVIATSTAAATATGTGAILAALAAIVSGSGVATVSCGLIWRRFAARTRGASLALVVIAVLMYAGGAAIGALQQTHEQSRSAPTRQAP
jgi:hypothetical protein